MPTNQIESLAVLQQRNKMKTKEQNRSETSRTINSPAVGRKITEIKHHSPTDRFSTKDHIIQSISAWLVTPSYIQWTLIKCQTIITKLRRTNATQQTRNQICIKIYMMITNIQGAAPKQTNTIHTSFCCCWNHLLTS